jgi:hypothetical protein
VDNLTEEQILSLFGESLELLELRDPRRDFRATAWQYTFTTSMQEQDNPADFRWRCLHSDNPASNRFAGPDCRQLTHVRALKWSGEETAFARSGRQPPRFISQPQDVHSTEGETAKLHAKAEGVPAPSYQWFAVDRAGNEQIIVNGTDAELVVHNPPLGKSRFVVRASNSLGDVTSEVASLSVEKKLRLSQTRPTRDVQSVARPTAPSYVRSADDIDRQRRRIEAEMAEEHFRQGLRRRKILTVCSVILVLVALAGFFWWQKGRKQKAPVQGGEMTNSPSTQSAPAAATASPLPTDLPPSQTASEPPEVMQQPSPAPAPLAPETNAHMPKVMADVFTNTPPQKHPTNPPAEK